MVKSENVIAIMVTFMSNHNLFISKNLPNDTLIFW